MNTKRRFRYCTKPSFTFHLYRNNISYINLSRIFLPPPISFDKIKPFPIIQPYNIYILQPLFQSQFSQTNVYIHNNNFIFYFDRILIHSSLYITKKEQNTKKINQTVDFLSSTIMRRINTTLR